MDLEIFDGLPLDISRLEGLSFAAEEEGIKNVSRLIQDWILGQTLFDGTGECLCLAEVDGLIIGVGGLLKCKVVPDALRVSRFYVHPDWRRKGIAREIANEALSHVWDFAKVVTCNAQASSIASPFWELLGFRAVNMPGITHLLDVSKIS